MLEPWSKLLNLTTAKELELESKPTNIKEGTRFPSMAPELVEHL